ncbi:MAG: epoxyqueuosine reductase [Desulfobacterales bacterium]|nr:epoxyqueuosine reductase [Desulfobacterales bacterium]
MVKEMAKCLGVTRVGIATRKTLAGGPPSTDLTYVLDEAESAVCFALPLNPDYIEPYLRKEDHGSHYTDNIRTNTLASGIGLEMANFLKQKGFPSVPLAANLEYRTETPNGILDEMPPIAMRYLAVRSGVGHFGRSGNVIDTVHGAAIILGAVVTAAKLDSTPPLPEEDNYCDGCRLCDKACASGFMSPDETTTVTMGGVSFSYARRRSHHRCDYVCGGFAGLHPSGRWSTWSPARFPIPEKDEDFLPAIITALKPFLNRPEASERFFSILVPGHKLELTCGNCQLVCHPDKDLRKRRYRMLADSGVVIQFPDGSRRAVTPEEAEAHLAAMDEKTRALYQ